MPYLCANRMPCAPQRRHCPTVISSLSFCPLFAYFMPTYNNSLPTYFEALFSLHAEHPLAHLDCLWLPTSPPHPLGISISLGTEAKQCPDKERMLTKPFEDQQGRLGPTKSSPEAKATLCCFRPSRDRKTLKSRGQPLTIVSCCQTLPFAFFSSVRQLAHIECFWLFLCLWQIIIIFLVQLIVYPLPCLPNAE